MHSIVSGNPFVRHEFLSALERAGCVGEASGWTPSHLILENDRGELEGALPLYRKTHSWGEFVFDWSWARAWSQAGLRYYPKLVSMTPFTPATAPHLIARGGDADARGTHGDSPSRSLNSRGAKACPPPMCCSSMTTIAQRCNRRICWRKDCQFHWRNRNYSTSGVRHALRAEKRKKTQRERDAIAEDGVEFDTYTGDQIDRRLWRYVFAFSAATFAAHGHEHYLNVEFFNAVSAALPESVMVKVARYRGGRSPQRFSFAAPTLCMAATGAPPPSFTACTSKPATTRASSIAFEHGLARFEPGTQGEHKVPRGFEPTTTWSAHFIADPRFARAIDAYLLGGACRRR